MDGTVRQLTDLTLQSRNAFEFKQNKLFLTMIKIIEQLQQFPVAIVRRTNQRL